MRQSLKKISIEAIPHLVFFELGYSRSRLAGAGKGDVVNARERHVHERGVSLCSYHDCDRGSGWRRVNDRARRQGHFLWLSFATLRDGGNDDDHDHARAA